MTANIGSTVDKDFIGRVEMPDVASLHDEHDDPVNACDNSIEGEGCSHVLVLAPYGMAPVIMFAIGWSIEGIINGYDDNQEP